SQHAPARLGPAGPPAVAARLYRAASQGRDGARFLSHHRPSRTRLARIVTSRLRRRCDTIAIMDKKPSANAEALARKLHEKLQSERRGWTRWLPALAGILLIVLVILAWALYPKPDPPRMTVSVSDELNVRGEPAVVHAFLDPENPDAKVDSLKGLE